MKAHNVLVVNQCWFLFQSPFLKTYKPLHFFANVIGDKKMMDNSYTVRLYMKIHGLYTLSNSDVFHSCSFQSLLLINDMQLLYTIVVISDSSLLSV